MILFVVKLLYGDIFDMATLQHDAFIEVRELLVIFIVAFIDAVFDTVPDIIIK